MDSREEKININSNLLAYESEYSIIRRVILLPFAIVISISPIFLLGYLLQEFGSLFPRKDVPLYATIYLIFIIIFEMIFINSFEYIDYIGKKKFSVKPVLVIGEKNPTYWDTQFFYNFGLVFGVRARESNFILSEEGIVNYKWFGLLLIRWEKFTSYKANPETYEFKLKLKRGEINLLSNQQFNEVNKILSEHLPLL